jgi:hypothetical protein
MYGGDIVTAGRVLAEPGFIIRSHMLEAWNDSNMQWTYFYVQNSPYEVLKTTKQHIKAKRILKRRARHKTTTHFPYMFPKRQRIRVRRGC